MNTDQALRWHGIFNGPTAEQAEQLKINQAIQVSYSRAVYAYQKENDCYPTDLDAAILYASITKKEITKAKRAAARMRRIDREIRAEIEAERRLGA
jgi:hypothetical protein